MVLEKSAAAVNISEISGVRALYFDMLPCREQKMTFAGAEEFFAERGIGLTAREMEALGLLTAAPCAEPYAQNAAPFAARCVMPPAAPFAVRDAIPSDAHSAAAFAQSAIPSAATFAQSVMPSAAPCAQSVIPSAAPRDGAGHGAGAGIGPPAGMLFTNAALLISDQCGHEIHCAVFGGKAVRGGVRRRFAGSALRQYADVYEYVMNCGGAIERRGHARVDQGIFPESLRELLLNAIIHRSFTEPEHIQINVYDERVDIVSPGGLAKGVSMKAVLGGAAFAPRNAALTGVFRRLGLLTGAGDSIRRIISGYSGCLVEPVFRQSQTKFSVSLPRMLGGDAPVRGHMRLKEDYILKAIAHRGSITRAEVEEALKSSRNAAITLLDGLIDEGRIVKIGTAKTIRYILPQ
jgi:hypothetical protein